MAECVLRHLAKQHKVDHLISVDSSGTSGYHDGEFMHQGTYKKLSSLGIETAGFVSSKTKKSDVDYFDYMIVMDDNNLRDVEALCGKHPEKIFKLTDLIPESGYDHVPDPWYTKNFEETYALVSAGCEAFLRKLNLIK